MIAKQFIPALYRASRRSAGVLAGWLGGVPPPSYEAEMAPDSQRDLLERFDYLC